MRVAGNKLWGSDEKKKAGQKNVKLLTLAEGMGGGSPFSGKTRRGEGGEADCWVRTRTNRRDQMTS